MTVRRRAALVAACLLVGGCVSGREPTMAQPPQPQPAADTGWTAARTRAVDLAEAGRYGDADSVLAAFARGRRGTAEGSDALYWRALLLLDPANPTATPREAIVAIDAYLAGGAAQPHYEELLVLRRLAGNLERIRLLAVEAESLRVAPPVDTTAAAALAAQQAAEITRLKAELERTQAELERLRRRIRPDAAGGRPPPRREPQREPAA